MPFADPPKLAYDRERWKIQSGDILLFEGRGFWSALIRFATSSRISHAGIVVDLHGRVACLEAAEGRGVQLWPVSAYLAKGLKIHWYRLLDDEYDLDRQSVVDFAFSQWGKRYASWNQFARSFTLVWSGVAQRIGLPADSDGERWFCSELVAGALRYAGLADERTPARTSPGDLQFLKCLKYEGVLQ